MRITVKGHNTRVRRQQEATGLAGVRAGIRTNCNHVDLPVNLEYANDFFQASVKILAAFSR